MIDNNYSKKREERLQKQFESNKKKYSFMNESVLFDPIYYDEKSSGIINEHTIDITVSDNIKIFKLISNTWTQIGQTITGALEREYFGTGFSLSDDGTIFTVSASQFYIINEKGYTNIYKFIKDIGYSKVKDKKYYIININTLTYEKYILSADNNNTLEIPANYGHLFYTSSENTIVLYNLDGYYDSKTDKTFNYQDPELNLDICNNTDFIISEKDKNASFINTYDYMILGSSGFLGDYALKTLLKKLYKTL